MFKVLSVIVLALLGGCALSHTMPPFSVTRSYATSGAREPVAPAGLPARRTFNHHKSIQSDFDQATNQTRVWVTTHRGMYFLWMQRPRLTFFYVYEGPTLTQTPASVFLVFRTQNPQLPVNNRLTFACDGKPHGLGVTPTFWIEPQALTTNRHYMYELPVEVLSEFVGCQSASITVGDVVAPFAVEQQEALRDFAARMLVQ